MKLQYLITRRTPRFQRLSVVPAAVQLTVLAVEVDKVDEQFHADTAREARRMPYRARLGPCCIHR